jgi:hypothetical protein
MFYLSTLLFLELFAYPLPSGNQLAMKVSRAISQSKTFLGFFLKAPS